MFADCVVNSPVDPFIVVILLMLDELNVSPVEFSMYPAPDNVPPVSPVAVTVLPVSVPLYKDAPLAIFTFPLNDPFLACRSPVTTRDAPSQVT